MVGFGISPERYHSMFASFVFWSVADEAIRKDPNVYARKPEVSRKVLQLERHSLAKLRRARCLSGREPP
jgi:hypothetical protein